MKKYESDCHLAKPKSPGVLVPATLIIKKREKNKTRR
jgi:hypothetical protein